MTLNPARDFQHEDHKLEGRYFMALVIDNVYTNDNEEDPQHLGRVKVRIAEIHRGIEDSDLPWAVPIAPWYHGMNGKVFGFSVPAIGTYLWVVFFDNTGYSLGYMGAALNSINAPNDLLGGDDYPSVYGWTDQSGNYFSFNTKTDSIFLKHVSGTALSIDGAGHVEMVIADGTVGPNAEETLPKGISIHCTGDADLRFSGDGKIQIQGDLSLICNGKTKIQAQDDCEIITGGKAKINAQDNCEISVGGDAKITASNVSIETGKLEVKSGGGGGASPEEAEEPGEAEPAERPEEVDVSGQTDL